MKNLDLLMRISILSVVLLALHISQDIVYGFSRGGLNQLAGVAILLVVLCGAVGLRQRGSGQLVMPLGGVLAMALMPLHLWQAMRPVLLDRSGAPVVAWLLYALGRLAGLS